MMRKDSIKAEAKSRYSPDTQVILRGKNSVHDQIRAFLMHSATIL